MSQNMDSRILKKISLVFLMLLSDGMLLSAAKLASILCMRIGINLRWPVGKGHMPHTQASQSQPAGANWD